MSYSIESVNNYTKKIVFNFESLNFASDVKSALLKKRKEAQIKGFRKGKVPMEMIEKFYGSEVEQEALNGFIQKTVEETITDEKLFVVGTPTIENMKYSSLKSASFDVVVEIMPKIELKNYSGMSFQRKKVEVRDVESELEAIKKKLRMKKAEMVEVDDPQRALGRGLTAVIDFQGEMEDGERPSDLTGREYYCELGSGDLNPEFEQEMIGMKVGEKKIFSIHYGADADCAEKLRGNAVKFEVDLLEIKEKVLPEFNDEFVKKLEYASVQDFEEKSRQMIVSHKNNEADEKLRREIIEALVNENPFDLPRSAIADQEDWLKEQSAKEMRKRGMDDFVVDEYLQEKSGEFSSIAESRLRSRIIFDALVDDLGVEVDEAEYGERVDRIVQGVKEEARCRVREYYRTNREVKEALLGTIREDKMFEALYGKMNII